MKRNLCDMVVVITGASAGIGEGLARELSARGAKLVLAARRSDRLRKLNDDLGGGHVIVEADVAKQENCQRLIDTAFRECGRIDTLVLNAGYGVYPPVHLTSPETVRAIFATNVFGTSDCISAAVPRMLAQPLRDGVRGQVMVVSSVAARRAVPYLGHYSATKAAQLSITEAMRVELAPRQLAVTSVHPAMTRTEFGATAEAVSNVKLPVDDRGKWSQSLEQVVAKMVRAIEKPRPEVWPMRPSRWAILFAVSFPGLSDRLLAKYRRRVEAANQGK
ncbi:MAG: short-chain dehydrogenase/reductase [Phycisphaerales bacterium]|nr:short-chain dehydrogenase/reductase [Phycisphaerales bacterium]